MRSLEHYARKHNIKISRNSITLEENIIGIVKDIGSALVIEVQEHQITVHRSSLGSIIQEGIHSIAHNPASKHIGIGRSDW